MLLVRCNTRNDVTRTLEGQRLVCGLHPLSVNTWRALRGRDVRAASCCLGCRVWPLLQCTPPLPLPSAFDKKKAGMAIGHTAKLSDEIDMWSHVKSLYQNPNATCLYGKNNILMKLVSVKWSHQQLCMWALPCATLSPMEGCSLTYMHAVVCTCTDLCSVYGAPLSVQHICSCEIY